MVREAKSAIPDDYARERPIVGLSSVTWSSPSDLWSISRSFIFREPVDPIALGIPQYHEIIPKKDARDLKMIRSKLDNDRYESLDTFEADLDLMVDNAITFNGEGSDVGLVAAQMRDLYRRLTSE